jgi:hypothetical protein
LYLYEGGLPLQKKRSKDVVAADFMLWRFEEMVRDKYQNFLRQYFGHTLRDGVEQQKIKRCDQRQFTRTVPEGESILLAMIVNKLGDPEEDGLVSRPRTAQSPETAPSDARSLHEKSNSWCIVHLSNRLCTAVSFFSIN